MQTKNPFPWYAPRFWHGMTSSVWWRLLRDNHWRVSWRRFDFLFSVSLMTPGTDLAGSLQHLIYGRKIQETKLAGPPVFVLGHWRSGTTLLHELLQLDERLSSPNTYQCFAPWHFLLTEKLITSCGNFLVPKHRPMDNMRMGWKLPQEDEFALMTLGVNSPYRRIAFPLEDVDIDTLATQTFPAKDLERWKECFHWFMQAITYREKKPLVLKSPTHTGRIQLLAEMYPDAKFIHLSRHPFSMIPSTIKLWQSLSMVQGMQTKLDPVKDEDYVFACFKRMYEGYQQGSVGLPANRLYETTYEALVADPIETVRSIYETLGLEGFDVVRGKIQARMQADSNYKVNQWRVSESLAERMRGSCQWYAQRYGFDLPTAG